MDLLRWIIFVIITLWIVWFLTGGQYSGKTGEPFLRPPAPLDTRETYGEIPLPLGISQGGSNNTDEDDSDDNKISSIFKGSINFQFGNPREKDFNKEYIVISASYNNTQPVNITGWKLKSALSGKNVTIGQGVYLPFSGIVNKEADIFLNPGDKAVIATGHSPKGVSFRLNTCTGYFEQFQNFTPALPQQCPRPANEEFKVGLGRLNDTCIDYIEQIPSCFAHIQAVPIGLSAECNEFINKNIHYNGCLQIHKNDSNFYKQEWRIFLKRDSELWKDRRETIKLLDTAGKTIDSLSY